MDQKKESRTLFTQSAMYFGLLLGAYYIVRFLVMILGFKYPMWSPLFVLLSAGIPFVVLILASRALSNHFEEILPFYRILLYCFYLFMYASLIDAIVEYAYFEFVDPTLLARQYASSIETLKSLEQTKALADAVKDVAVPSAANYAFSNLSMNFFFGILLSFPIAGFITYRNRRMK